MKHRPTIGLEIHAELKTRTKMFCDSLNDPDETRPNTNVCPVCLGHPGTLPTINKKAVEEVIRVGLALGGKINPETKFDRKNYFYPDLPKGYQISQYDKPLVTGGELLGKRITRIHLEEDAGTLVHRPNGNRMESNDKRIFEENSSTFDQDSGATLVDFNRAGAPLMELVTEPDFTSAEEVVAFARELQLILRYLCASDADMEKGLMRIEANVSIRPNKDRIKSNEKRIVLPDESYKLMGLLFEIHNKLGPVYKEKNYQDAIEAIFVREKIPYEREKKIELKLDDAVVSNFFADFIIDKEILLEVKATKSMSQNDIRQVLHYIKSADLPLGIVVNFRKGELEYKRLINPKFDKNSIIFDKDSSENLGTKVEIKNLNSFRAVGLAINYEIERQTEVLGNGAKVSQETRGWDEAKQKTVGQRSKEEAHDYRYFPEPDLPPFETKIFKIEELRNLLPELPAAKRARFLEEYHLNDKQIETLVGEPKLAEFFEESVSELTAQRLETGDKMHEGNSQTLFNYLTSDLRGLMNEKNTSFGDSKIGPEHLAHLVVLIEKGKIGSRQAKDVLKKMFETGLDPEEIVQSEGLETVSDTAELENIVTEIIQKNSKAVEDYKKGKAASLQFLIGQAMGKLRGRGNPATLKEIFERSLR
ncbi:MAG: GxxExxY protein [Candidatus Liptonbacteria bacterium]|nr:GxxExxY protein [Candidatus Liptonbacteria bacterium]